jgi:hypothetical protein
MYTVYTYKCMVLASGQPYVSANMPACHNSRVGQTVYDRIFGDFLAENTVYTLYMYGSGQPYTPPLFTAPVN